MTVEAHHSQDFSTQTFPQENVTEQIALYVFLILGRAPLAVKESQLFTLLLVRFASRLDRRRAPTLERAVDLCMKGALSTLMMLRTEESPHTFSSIGLLVTLTYWSSKSSLLR